MHGTITQLREDIDRIDRFLVELLNQRATAVVRIGQIKKREGLQVEDSSREADVVKRAEDSNRGPFSRNAIRNLFKAIMSESRKLQA